jgi:hypothetical protein
VSMLTMGAIVSSPSVCAAVVTRRLAIS